MSDMPSHASNPKGISLLDYFQSLELEVKSAPTLGRFRGPKKNSGRLWLAYTEHQVGFNMLQLITVDSGHFTQPELSL